MTSPLHRPSRWQHRSFSRHAAGLVALCSLALAGEAHASCLGPQAAILWSYPDETTASVPPDAVFWAVSHAGSVAVAIDGVALEPRGTGPVERHQFVPVAPLTEGPHELVVRASEPLQQGDERRVPFQVVAGPEVTGSASISSVDVYPLLWNDTTGEVLSPPDDGCSEPVTQLEWSCDDIIPERITRVRYESDGDIVAYLAQGGVLVPPGCASLSLSYAESFHVAAVLPSGLTEEVYFTGAVEEHALEELRPDLYQQPRACSVGFGRGAPNALGVAASVALAAWVARRRRR
jgi:hypothetical protein